jgi:hypothetical protein
MNFTSYTQVMYHYILKRQVQETPFRCIMCGKSFTHHEALMRHKRCDCKPQESHNHFRSEEKCAGGILNDVWDEGTSTEFWDDCSADELETKTKNPLLMLQQYLVSRSTPGSLPPFLVNKVFDVLSEKREDSNWIDYLDVYYVMNKTAMSVTYKRS